MTGRRNEKRLYWNELVARQAASGLSVREFCSQAGVSEPSFYMWRRKFAAERRGEGKPSHRRAALAGVGEFIPLTLRDEPGALEVVHPRGYRIRITGQADAALLARVLDLLDGRNME